jgi:hypothetical protein
MRRIVLHRFDSQNAPARGSTPRMALGRSLVFPPEGFQGKSRLIRMKEPKEKILLVSDSRAASRHDAVFH